MDVLRPPLVYLDGRCYRKLPFEQQIDQGECHQGYAGDGNDEDETCDAMGLVEQTAKGYKLSVDIPSALFGSIVGWKGETKKRIEQDTKTVISIPRKGEDGPIFITGPQKSGILSASNRIEVIAESSREKKPYTHFLSFPLYNDKLIDRFEEFRSKVLKECDQCSGIEPSIFQIPSKLHLTIGMMTLLNKTEVDKASDFLSSCCQELVRGDQRKQASFNHIVKKMKMKELNEKYFLQEARAGMHIEFLVNSPVEVNLRGVEYMNDDPMQVDVLYMKVQSVDGSDRLQRLADALLERFVAEGLIKKEYEHVKLHATVMNSRFREDASIPAKKGQMDTAHPRWKKRVSFDAQDIMKMFDYFDFGKYHLGSIHLSQRGKFDATGHYFCATSVPLP